jgi:hypothetical protein
MIDANEKALKTYLDEQEKQEINLNAMLDEFDDELFKLGEIINDLQAQAKDYNGYDFTKELNDALEDLI